VQTIWGTPLLRSPLDAAAAGTAPSVSEHCAFCAMPFLAALFKMRLPRAGAFESTVRKSAFSVALWLLLMTATLPVSRAFSLTFPTRTYRTFGMMILKVTCAVARSAAPGAPLATRDSGTAFDGSSHAPATPPPTSSTRRAAWKTWFCECLFKAELTASRPVTLMNISSAVAIACGYA